MWILEDDDYQREALVEDLERLAPDQLQVVEVANLYRFAERLSLVDSTTAPILLITDLMVATCDVVEVEEVNRVFPELAQVPSRSSGLYAIHLMRSNSHTSDVPIVVHSVSPRAASHEFAADANLSLVKKSTGIGPLLVEVRRRLQLAGVKI